MKKIQSSISYIAIASLINRKIVIDYISNKNSGQSNVYRHSAKDIIDKLILISITSNERHTESMNTEWKILSAVDNSVRWVFIAIVIRDFPERIGYKMLSELEQKSLKSLNEVYLPKISQDNIQSVFKSYADDIQLSMVEFERKYRDLTRSDNIKGLQSEVNSIQITMKGNLNQMVQNLEVVSDLENKADALKTKAEDFKKNAYELNKITWWSNKKWTIAAGGIGVTGGLFLLFKFIL